MQIYLAIVTLMAYCPSALLQRIYFPDEMLKLQPTRPPPSPPLINQRPTTPVQPVPMARPSRPTQTFQPAPVRPIQSFAPTNQNTLSQQQVNNIISNGITSLTLSIDQELAISQARSGNDNAVVFSPVSIAEALALVLLGSNGKTFDELASTLGFSSGTNIEQNSQLIHQQFGRLLGNLNSQSNRGPGVRSSRASGIFVQEGYPIREEYKRTAVDTYQSEIVGLDFERNANQAQSFINNWVAQKTSDKIKTIVPYPPPRDTKVIITSALYFKGEWEHPFIAEATQRRPFFPYGRRNRTQVTVDMMANGGEFLYYKDKQLDCSIIALPYKGNTTSMYIILPNDSSKDKLRRLEDSLRVNHIERLIASMKRTDVILVMPKMRLTSTMSLRNTLMQLGVRSLFDPQEADLSLLSEGNQQPTNPSKPNIDYPPIFSRFGETNCGEMFESNSLISNCTDDLPEPLENKTKVIYKRFGIKIGRRFARNLARSKRQSQRSRNSRSDSLDAIRNSLNGVNSNPGLYADEVLHKVFIDITETGTEAAAATSVSISRDGGRAVFRMDTPFLFFIRHKESKLNLFWGSVNVPTPSY